jgi:microcystin-dependent protein
MSDPYIGEIRMVGFNFAPVGWLACDGSLLPIAQYEVLFTLIGTTYGGDGETTFALPDLRGRIPLHQGTGPGLSPRALGEMGGSEIVSLVPAQLPAHGHALQATTAAADSTSPGPARLPAAVSGDTFYVDDLDGASPLGMADPSTTPAGGGQPHENLMPTQTVQFCIAYEGVFPSQS